MLTFEQIKEMAKNFAIEDDEADNVWFIRKLGDWYYFLYKQSGLPKWTGFPMGLRISIKGDIERINDTIIRTRMMNDKEAVLI